MIGAVLPHAPERPTHGDATDAAPDTVALLPFAAMLAALVAPPELPPPPATPSASTPPATVPPEPQPEVEAQAQARAQAQAVLVAPVPPSRHGRDQNQEVPPPDVASEQAAPPTVAAPDPVGTAEPTLVARTGDRVETRAEPLPTPRPATAVAAPSPVPLEAVVPRPPAHATTPTLPPATASAVTVPPIAERAAPAPAVPAPPPAVPLDHSRLARDLRARIEPLHTSGDGTYEVHVDLHPAELGHVEVDVRVQDGVVHLRLHADHDGARHALRDALPDLRSSLEQAGVTTGDLRFDDRRAPARDPQAAAEPETVSSPGGPRAVATPTPSPSTAPTNDDAVDLLL